MDAPLHNSKPFDPKIELPMLLLVSELFDANRGNDDKVREIFNEVVFKDRPNPDVLSQLSQDHKKKIIALRIDYNDNDKKTFVKLFNVQLNSQKPQVDEIGPIQKKDSSNEVKKEKERVVDAPVHDLSKDEELARQLQAEWGMADDDAAFARQLHQQINQRPVGHSPIIRRSGHPEMFFASPHVRNVRTREPEDADASFALAKDVLKLKLSDTIHSADRVIRKGDPEYNWLQNNESVFVDKNSFNKRIYCGIGSKVYVAEGCKNIVIIQCTNSEVAVNNSEVIFERVIGCVITADKGSKLNLVNSYNNEIKIAKDCTISVYPDVKNHIVVVDAIEH